MSDTVVYSQFKWAALMMLVLGVISQSFVMIFPVSLLEEIAKGLGVGVGAATGGLMGTFSIAVALASVIGGILNDRFGLIPMYLTGNIIMLVSTLVTPIYGHTMQAIIVLRIMQALGAGPIMASMSHVAALWFPPQQRGMVAGLGSMSIFFGVAITMGIAPIVRGVVGSWQMTVAWMSVIPVISLLAALVVAFGPKPQVAAGKSGLATDNGLFKQACRQPATWLGIVVIFFGAWGFNALNNVLPPYFSIERPMGLDFGIIMAGQLAVVQQIGYMVGSVGSAIALHLFKGKVNKVLMLAYSLSAIFVATLIIPSVVTNTFLLFVFLFLTGFFLGMAFPVALAFIAMHYPSVIIGKINGMWMGLGFLGGTVGIIVSAIITEATGGFVVPIGVVCIVALLGLIVSAFLTPPKTFCSNHGGSKY